MPQEYIPGQGWVEVGGGDLSLGNQPPRGGLLQPPPQAPPETPERAAEMDTAMKTMGEGASTGMDLLSLVLPFLGPVKAISPIARMAIQSGLGAGSGGLRGGMVTEPGLGGALEGALIGGGLQSAMEMAPKVEHGFNKAAYRLGGFSKKGAGEAEGALRSVNQDLAKERSIFKPATIMTKRPLTVGAEARTDKLVGKAGQDVGATRAADPNVHDIFDTFKGAADPLFKEAVDTRSPIENLTRIQDELNKFIKSHQKLRGPSVPTEELGKLEVGLKHSPEAKNLRTAKNSKEIVTAAEQKMGQFDQAMADASREARYAKEGPSGPMREADRKHASLKRVQANNARMRAPEIVTDPGKMSARAGFSSGLGRMAGFGLGAAGGGSTLGPAGAVLGGGLGALMFSPVGLSLAGQAGESSLELIPQLLRLNRFLSGVQETTE